MNSSNTKLVPAPVWSKAPTEWPTVVLFLVVALLHAISIYTAIHSPAWTWAFFAIFNTICVYGAFTIVHEASHRNISRRYPRLEYFLGFYTTMVFFHGAFEQFIAIHLRHHAKVNQEGEDPDLHAKGPFTFWRALGWGGTLWQYSSFFWRNGLYRRGRAIKLITPYIIITTLYVVAFAEGFLPALIVLATIPTILGTSLTIIVFDHIPHHPHNSSGKYTNARMYPSKGVDWLTFMQSHHLIHHLWPSIPWYRYRECYAQRRQDLLEAGAIEVGSTHYPAPKDFSPKRRKYIHDESTL
jgi:beta-carotene hydroxylase